MTEPCRVRKGVVENSETIGLAFLGMGLRVGGTAAAMVTDFAAGTRDGFIGESSGGATSSLDAFLFSPECQQLSKFDIPVFFS